MNELKDYIFVFDNMVPQDLCDAILAEYANSNEWLPAAVGQVTNSVDRNRRNCDSIGISHPVILEANPYQRKRIDTALHVCMQRAIATYSKNFFHCQTQQDTGYDLLRYGEGGLFIAHTDAYKDAPRAVSCSISLNEDYEGGEFAFFNQTIKYKIPRGSVLMFPSNFMYPHEILPITKGVRYSIVTWFV
jgi:hypothetical protein